MTDSVPERIPEELVDTTPATKLVWQTLAIAEEDELTQQQLTDRTGIAPRTVRYAVTELETRDAIESRPDVRQPNQPLYYHPRQF